MKRHIAAILMLACLLASAQQAPKGKRPPVPPPLPQMAFALEDALGGMSFSMPVAVVSAPGEEDRLFVVEKTGCIQAVTKLHQPTPTKQLFANLTERPDGKLEDKGECGLLGLAFHPDYAHNKRFFVCYSLRIDGRLHQRVSRFDGGTEQPLITQRDPAGNHNGGDLHFGPDGFLYISAGDGGGANDLFDSGRFIHKDFHAAILRIDVDKKAGSLPPNPHPAVHVGTYTVPADNPFIGATSHHGEKIDPSTVRTEIWATGLRNVWRFSFDPPTGRLFAADVGQNLHEEVNLIVKGGDYGWSHREGMHAFDLGPGKDMLPAVFKPIDPIFEYPRTTGLSITGGRVYRGTQFPEFKDAYLCADYAFGRVIAAREKNGRWEQEIIAFEPAITGIGVDPRDGELLFCNMAKGSVMRLARVEPKLEDVTPSVRAGVTQHWPQFRGAAADGLGEGATLPETWSGTENVVWKVKVPGWGWSSPIVWGDKVFVTSAVGEKELPVPQVGGYPGGHVGSGEVHRWMLYCLDFATGKILWEFEAHQGVPPQMRHPRSSFANETPVTDGERVYGYFANIGLFCCDMNGKKLWERRWPSYPMRDGWNTGTSPVLHGGRVFIQNDNDQESWLETLDKLTGKTLWHVAREEQSTWSTPYVWESGTRSELVTIGANKIRSYVPADGALLWELSGTAGLVSQIPLSKHGLLYAGAGYHYGPLYAIKPGTKGDITLQGDATSNEFIAWSQKRGSSIHPGYLISGDKLFVCYDSGLLGCFNAKTGEEIIAKQRLNTKGGRFYASPWAYNGRVFMLNENGDTWVLEDGPEYKLVRKNSLGDVAWATPAIARGSLFIRTFSSLFRIQNKK